MSSVRAEQQDQYLDLASPSPSLEAFSTPPTSPSPIGVNNYFIRPTFNTFAAATTTTGSQRPTALPSAASTTITSTTSKGVTPSIAAFMDTEITPSISRRSSRPTSLRLGASQAEWNPDIELLVASSPNPATKTTPSGPIGASSGVRSNLARDDSDGFSDGYEYNSKNGRSRSATLTRTVMTTTGSNGTKSSPETNLPPSATVGSTTVSPSPSSPASLLEVPATAVPKSRDSQFDRPMASPCFVHSHLDKGASLTDWLRSRQRQVIEGKELGVAKSLQTPIKPPPGFGHSADPAEIDDDGYGVGSLTEQLAETAVGVREMSKQLGRARVRSNIQTVLIITKARDNRLIKLTRELALYLMHKKQPGQSRGLIVYVDNQLRNSKRFDAEGIEREYPELFTAFPRRRTSSSSSVSSTSTHSDAYPKEGGQLRYWTSSMCSNSPHLFDFVVTLGGDGTVLFTSWLFQRIVPPVLPFALGSLGFLTNFDFAEHQAVMDSAIDNGIRVNLRMRFTCTVYRSVVMPHGKGRKAVRKGDTGEILMKNIEKGGWEALENGYSTIEGKAGGRDKEIKCFTTRPVETFEVLNDLVVDRGPSPYVSLLELFGDEHHMTTVQADGLTVSTPTGSTAYSLSAGGSLVHPEIPALLITPICPHTLSFRPMLLPDTMELRICVPYNSRSTAWASFDGRGRVELKQGDHIKVTASKYPFPTVCADNQSIDWFQSISRTLKWNERERQKSFVVVEEGPERPKRCSKKSSVASGASSPTDSVPEQDEQVSDDEEDEVSDEQEEDDKFDIDDSSPEADNTVASSSTRVPDAPGGQVLIYAPAHEAVSKKSAPSRRAASKSRSRSRGPRSRSNGTIIAPRAPQVVHRNADESHRSAAGAGGPASSADTEIFASRARIDYDSVRTQTTYPQGQHGRGRGALRSGAIAEQTQHPSGLTGNGAVGHKAFAFWGHDESDSCASDSDL